MRLSSKLFILVGILVFATGLAAMVTTFTAAFQLDASAQASGTSLATNTSSALIAFALAGFLLASAGSSLFRNVGAHHKQQTSSDR